MTAKPTLASNDIFAPTTTPASSSAFQTKKPTNSGDKKLDDKMIDDKLKRDALPLFIVDPVDTFIIRSKAAELLCRVVGADKAYFTCNGEAMAAADRHKEEDRMEVIGDQVRPNFGCDIYVKLHFHSAVFSFWEPTLTSLNTLRYDLTNCCIITSTQ